MNRKEFLKTVGRTCGCAGALSLAAGSLSGMGSAETGQSAGSSQAPAGAAAKPTPPVTPIERKMEFAHVWVKRFFDVLDREVDEPTRTRLMTVNGRECHRHSLKGRTPQRMTADELVAKISAGGGDIRREGDVVYFNYSQNPKGLKVSDGYCLCPLVEDGPEGLSGTYCQCSVGYVADIFEGILGQPVRVELLESLKRGGKGCRFKVSLKG